MLVMHAEKKVFMPLHKEGWNREFVGEYRGKNASSYCLS